ncbi:PLP-dependent aminotransferase family protein [Paenibacillus antri]|uniref:PLP-dependent aminotransferase family protein n=1 Tax=Paenibacillus antri TaxID=2582848 RepID=A0A5R9G879_9BACL|nr:PLP-dependent aminotransferase family protein [Paenibacillus antri]TLS48953.1 PLP-dependent aminotransferase family protein [Paenibacillus antri]
MHIELNRRAGVPLAEQIARAFEARIASGLLSPGEKLPSVRALARLLGVSLVTASKGYAALEASGAIRCVQGKGCFVSRTKTAAAKAATASLDGEDAAAHAAADPYAWQHAVPDYLPRAQLWHHYQNVPATHQLHLSAIQRELLPSRDIMKQIQSLMSEDHALLTAYGSFQGDDDLRGAIARLLGKAGVRTSAADLLVTSGAQQGIDLVARTFVGPGDVVVVEAPTYNGAIDVFASRGARIVSVPMDGDGMDVDRLARVCDRARPKLVYTVPTYHNPTGTTMSAARRKRLYELAAAIDCLVVEDDPYSDMYFDRPPPPAIKSFDRTGHIVYIKSYSKLLSPGCRIAAVAASGTVLSRLVAAKTAADLGSPLLTQKAIYAYLASDRFAAYARSIRATLAERCALAESLLRRHAPKGARWTSPQGGLHLWVALPDGCDDRELTLAAQREDIAVLPGSVCYAADASHRYVRLCFSYMPEDSLAFSLARLGRLMRETRAT